MKKVMLAGLVLVFGVASVSANCTTDPAVAASVLAGRSIDASGGGENWKESHCSGGQLWKVGAGTAVDPAAEIGTWAVSDTDITYDYGSGGSYTWTLHKNSSDTYFFCNGSSQVASGTLGSLGGCSAPAP